VPQRSRPLQQPSPQTIEAVEQQSLAVLASAVRCTNGITAFRAQDPDPNALQGGQILGVRLDIFSTRQKTFRPPYHLLFQVQGDGRLKLHKHTIPASIALKPMLAKHMGPTQDVGQFARAIRRQLTMLSNTDDAVHHLESVIKEHNTAYEIQLVRRNEAGAVEVTIALLKLHGVAKLRLGPSKTIEKANVSLVNNINGARQKLELAFLENDGAIEGFIDRIHSI